MTPEWSKRAGVVLASPYWELTVVTEEDFKKYLKLQDEEFLPLKEAVQESNSYNDLDEEMMAIFDRAEAVALKKRREDEEIAEQDIGGYGRFHTTLDTYP